MAAFLLTLTRKNWLNFSAQSWGGTLLRVSPCQKGYFGLGFVVFFSPLFSPHCLFVKTAWKNGSFMGREGGYSSSHHQRAVSIPLSFSIILLSALDVQLCPRDRVCSPCVCVCLCGLSLETEVWAVVLYVSPAIIWQPVHLLWTAVTELNVGWWMGKQNCI